MHASYLVFPVCALLWCACGAGPRAVREQHRKEAALAAAAEAQSDEPYQVAASHILIAYAGAERADANVSRTKAEAQALAQELLARLRAGEDFATLAREYSDGPSGANGGALGSFSRNKMTKAFSDVAFALEVGEICDEPVETEFGYHVIRRDQ